MCEKYNGWTNYETWNIKLWMDNEHYTQEYWRRRAGECIEEPDNTMPNYLTDFEAATWKLEQELKEFYTDTMPEIGGCHGDLLSAALDRVNWREIADNLLEEYKEETI